MKVNPVFWHHALCWLPSFITKNVNLNLCLQNAKQNGDLGQKMARYAEFVTNGTDLAKNKKKQPKSVHILKTVNLNGTLIIMFLSKLFFCFSYTGRCN
jgi:hypothetical protein